jgi:cytochrome o ubiquinol oxidase operon protein cyoD
MHKTLSSRFIGFFGSLILTLAAFLIIARPELFRFPSQIAIGVILVLAILQALVQSIFFLNILSEKGVRWNLIVFASTLSIILIIVLGAIWIMGHLNCNMMPGCSGHS